MTALNGILLYVISSVFVCYLCFKKLLDPSVWNALFWIMILFSAINSCSKSFNGEMRGRALYFYTLYHPLDLIISKVIYNTLLLWAVNSITLLFYTWFIGSMVNDLGLFVLNLWVSSFCLSGILTLTAGIAGKTGNNFTLMAILSFPVTLPLLLITLRISKNAIDGLAFSVSSGFLWAELCLALIVAALCALLFPFLWKE